MCGYMFKYEGHEYVNMNAMIPSTDIINMRC